jgi:zinc protease
MPDRTVAPPFVKSVSFDLIKPEQQTLPNGLQVFFVSGGSQEVMKVEFVFEAGRWFETKTASAYFTAQLLSKGTQQKSSFEIAQIFDQYGAHLEVNPGLDFVLVSLYALNKNFEPVLELLMEILSEPVFPEKEVSQAKSVFIQNLKVNKEKTSYVASQAFRKNLFGEAHPYGVDTEESDVEKLKTADFRKHFETFIHTPKVFVAGKIDPASKALMLRAFRYYRAGKEIVEPIHPVKPGSVRDYLDKKETVQRSVRFGQRSALRSHQDYIPVLFVSHIVGGYFGSRLMKNIREEKGLTYGISASLHSLKRDSYLVIGADVNKENTELIFDEIRKELKKLRTDLISDDELETTRNHFIGSLQSEITTPFAHADKIKTITLFNLQEDHYQRMIRKIDSITPSEIRDIAERYFNESDFIQVAAG